MVTYATVFFVTRAAPGTPTSRSSSASGSGAALYRGAARAWVRSLEARHLERGLRLPAAYRLLTELRLVARQLSGGLDPVTLAQEMLESSRADVRFERAAVYVRSDGRPAGRRWPSRGPTADWNEPTRRRPLLGEAWATEHPVQERPALLGGQSRLLRRRSRCAWACGPSVWSRSRQAVRPRLLARRAERGAEEPALRLETALLFADVARSPPPRSAAGSPARSTTASPRSSRRSATSSTTWPHRARDLPDHEADAQGAARRDHAGHRRAAAVDLRPAQRRPDRRSGLGAALSDYVRQVGAGSHLTVHLVLDESPSGCRIETEAELLRIAQEAITNARKHAAAQNLWVTCRVDPPEAYLAVEDDGVGLGPAARDSFGLEVMRERAARSVRQLIVGTATRAAPTRRRWPLGLDRADYVGWR